MAVDITLTPINSGYNLSKINTNFVAIHDALQDAMSLSGNTPNAMLVDLDMDDHDVINVGNLSADTITIGGLQFFPDNVEAQGDKGWSPILAAVVDGSRRVLQLVDWTGGAGTKPTAFVNYYLGSTGLTNVLADATDFRGATGTGTGDMLAANNLNDLADKPTSRTNLGIGNVDNTSDVNKPVSTAQAAADLVAQSQEVGYNPQTNSYTLVIADAGKMVAINNASANTLTVPPNSTVAFPVKTRIDVGQYGAGQTTITAGAGVTIRSASSKIKLTTQYSGGSLIKIGTDEWWLFGDLSA